MDKSEVLTKVVIPIFSAFCSGLLVFFLIPDWQTTARQNEWIPKSEWISEVKDKGWIQKDSCPAYPLKISIVGPGENSSLTLVKGNYGNNAHYIGPDIIAQLSRSIESSVSHIGIIYKYDNDEHYRIIFTQHRYSTSANHYRLNDQGNIIRFSELFLPKFNSPSKLKMWVFVADEATGIGSMYLSLEEITSLPYILSYSSEANFNLEKKG